MTAIKRLRPTIALGCITTLALVIGCGEINTNNFTDAEHESLQEEFESIYSFKVDASLQEAAFGSGTLTITNNTNRDWHMVSVILNPSMESFTERAAFELGSKHGFRYPGNRENAIRSIELGQTVTLDLDRFIHTKTGEKFGLSRYKLRKAHVAAKVEYKGEKHACDQTLTWK